LQTAGSARLRSFDAFIVQCKAYDMPDSVRVQIMTVPIAMPVPAPVVQVPVVAATAPARLIPAGVAYRDQHADDIARLRRLRTRNKNLRGRALARAALAMEDWFHWVKSGPKGPGFWAEWGVDYGPKVSWTRSRNDVGWVEEHDVKRNDFARWLVAGGNVPNNHTAL
jgi:hypothetical protein